MNRIKCYRLVTVQLIIVYFCFLQPNISSEQLNTKPNRSYEYLDGILYYNYKNLEIDLFFKYPFNWKLFEYIDLFFHKDINVISFEIQNSEHNNIHNSKQIKKFFNQPYSYFPSIVNILIYELNFKNISMTELTKVKIQDLKNLFLDYNLNILKSEIAYIKENIPISKLQYSIEPYFFSESHNDKRITLDILILRGDKVYQIEYIANEEDYFNNLEEVTNFIDSIRFG